MWAAFTDLHAGNLALHAGDNHAQVPSHRARLERAMGVPGGSLAFMNQNHSTVAALAGLREPPAVEGQAPAVEHAVPGAPDASGALDASGAPDADAMVSAGGSRPLAVLVADCVPVVIAATAGDTGTVMIGVIHAGRLGVRNGIVKNTVAMMSSAGARSISAWIGPSICGNCYEVPAEMRDDVAGLVPKAWAVTRWDTPGLNLPAAVKEQLEQEGVSVHPVVAPSSSCTLENGDLYSHRGSTQGRPAGRFAGLVWRS